MKNPQDRDKTNGPRKKRLVWMDLEMTGLNPDTDQILEIATIITTSELEVIARGPNIAIHHPEDVLARMDEWCQEHHAASGLIQRVLDSGISLAEAEVKTLAFIRQHVIENSAPLCGNSIHQDRRFLSRYMPDIESFLHYRIIDVSSIKELVRRWYPNVDPPKKEETHLALKDIIESIEELRYYRRHYFR